jgi:hypothetical protein
MGYCAGYEHPGFLGVQQGRGRGLGRGFRGGFAYGKGPGFGFRHGYVRQFWGDVTDVKEKTLIENQIRVLKDQLSALEDRLSKIGE